MPDLETVIGLFGNIFTMFVVNMFFTAFFPWDYSKSDKVKRLVCFIAYYAVNSTVVFALHASPFVTLATNVAGYILVSFTYKGGVRRKICVMILIFVLSVTCENLVAYFVLNFNLRHRTLTIILVSNIVLYALAVIIKKRAKRSRFDGIKPIEWISTAAVSMASLFMSVVILYECMDEVKALIGGACIVFVNIFLIYSIDRLQLDYEKNLEYTLMEQENRAYRNQAAIIAESERRTRALRHDMKNHLVAISKLAERDSEMALEYVNSLISSTQLSSQFSNTGNIVLDGIVNMKLGEVKDEDIDIDVKISVPDKIGVEPKDLVIVLGNLLDNSIRGVKGCEEKKFLKLCIIMDRGRLMIELENSYRGILKEQDGKLESTKLRKTDHGIGLDSVEATVKEYGGEIEVEHDGRVFRVRVVMYPEAI